jgi:cyclic pyranopterin phosphate synthase
MASRVIPLLDERHAWQPRLEVGEALPTDMGEAGTWASGQALSDLLGRPLHDLRISVTDRCNFRCSYCMPKEVFDQNHRYLPQSDLLSFEEITRLAARFVELGVRKIRLTGGEPLLRRGLETLIEQLARLRTPQGKALDLTLTTNGALLARKAQALKDAGLQRVTVSLDGLDDAVFRAMNDVDFPVAEVLEGIEAAQAVGLGPIKVNMVVKKGSNEDQILPMAQHFKGTGIALRFIEYMDVGNTNGWRMNEVLPSSQVLETLQRVHHLQPIRELRSNAESSPAFEAPAGETAERFAYVNAQGEADQALGEIGLISSVTRAFCGDCNRARLSTEGKLYLCLFASQGTDLRSMLRSGARDEALLAAIAAVWQGRQDRYSALRGQHPASTTGATPRIEMSYIGG